MPDYTGRAKGIRFAGSKGKCGEITQIVNGLIRPGDVYYEPFLGAGKIMQGVRCDSRHGSDLDGDIVTLLNCVQCGWNPPREVTEDRYRTWMDRRGEEEWDDNPMRGFVLYGCSFGGRYGQGYARSKKKYVNFADSARTALLRQKPFLAGVQMWVADYRRGFSLRGRRGVMYCDPPYEGTKPVGSNLKPFDSKEFWEWAGDMVVAGWTVLVSEYTCPLPGAKVVWQKEVAAGIRFGTGGDGGGAGSGTRKKEKLYLLGGRGTVGLGLT